MLRHRLAAVVTTALGTGTLIVAGSAAATAVEPRYEMPFPCQQSWTGSTRPSHSPSRLAVDYNRKDDLNDLVTVSAPGVVSRVLDLGRRSYGLHVVVDHGDGRSTLYAHLSSAWLVPGQVVDQGMVLGTVGRSGNVTGPHLHYEQRVGKGVVAPVFHALPFAMGTTQASAACPDVPVVGDWNGDHLSEVGTFQRTPAASLQRAGNTPVVFGGTADDPVVGDWDGNGITDAGVRRGKNSMFRLVGAGGAIVKFAFGARGDRPVAGDWDGDGLDDIGVFRPASGQFLLRGADGTTTVVPWGSAGTYPVTGDWNGDGRTDVGSFDPISTLWSLRSVDTFGSVTTITVAFGAPGDLPVTGDWDGDGFTEVGAWTPATATYSLRQGHVDTPTAPAAPLIFGRAR